MYLIRFSLNYESNNNVTVTAAFLSTSQIHGLGTNGQTVCETIGPFADWD